MIRNLPTEDVYPNPDQPRKTFDEAKLREFAASIREHGLLQPITVRPDDAGRYMIVLGERRWRAHKLAAITTIKANVVRNITDAELAEQAIVENLQRVDIAPIEEARSFQAMLDKGYTVDTLPDRQQMTFHGVLSARSQTSLASSGSSHRSHRSASSIWSIARGEGGLEPTKSQLLQFYNPGENQVWAQSTFSIRFSPLRSRLLPQCSPALALLRHTKNEGP